MIMLLLTVSATAAARMDSSATATNATPTASTPPAVVVYGSTPGAIMAAVSAARVLKGHTVDVGSRSGAQQAAPVVVLVDPAPRIGGMCAGGLGSSDTGNPAVIGGLAHEFFVRVAQTYNANATTPQYFLEPSVAEAVFRAMLQEAGVVHVQGHGNVAAAPAVNGRLVCLVLEDGLVVGGASTVYIDGSYEGDVMARGNISYTYGREASTAYNESFAGRREPYSAMDHAPVSPFRANGSLPSYLPSTITEHYAQPLGSGDRKVQAYNFRLCVTTNASNAVPFPKPANYRRSDWELVFKLAASPGGSKKEQGLARFLNNFGHPLPNMKRDLNNGGVLSTDCAGCSWDYPDANYTHRKAVHARHKTYQQGFLWTLASDSHFRTSLPALERRSPL